MNKNKIMPIILGIISFQFNITIPNCSQENKSNDCPVTCQNDKTFFRARPIIQDYTLQFGLNNYNIYYNNNFLENQRECSRSHLFVTPFYMQSTNGCNLTKKFLPCCKTKISVKEDGTGDVESLWLELMAPKGEFFDSEITLNPKRKAYGAVFGYWQDLSFILNNLWFNIEFAAMKVEHNLRFKENLISSPGIIDDIKTVKDALNNPQWKYGKFSPCTLSKSGIDDVILRLGYNALFCPNYHLAFYLNGYAPASKKPNAKHIFEPTIGSGGHPGVGFGINGGYQFYDKCNHKLTYLADFDYLYLFSKTELRSFDLKQGDWSRFLRVIKDGATTISYPGINFFTLPSTVTPRSAINFWNALHYQKCNWHLELGYNLWYRQKEEVCPCKNLEDISIFDLAGSLNCLPISAHCANITQNIIEPNIAPSDTELIRTTNSDLNKNSAALSKALTHKFYAALAADAVCWCTPIQFGFGASYELAAHTYALDQWGVWFNLDFGF